MPIGACSGRAGRAALLAGLTLTGFLAGCAGRTPDAPLTDRPAPPVSTVPLPPVFYVDPYSPATRQVTRWEHTRADDAGTLRAIGDQPAAHWLVDSTAPVTEQVDDLLTRAARNGQTPVLVAHNLPGRDCGRGGSGGAGTAGAYRTWIRDLAAGVRGRPVIVILEPGGVADAVDRCVPDVEGRLALLRDAVAVLASTGNARVYLDAGHPGWVREPARLAAALTRAGIADADGFALNVANFFGTEENLRYGHRISDALGGRTTFVIDTSRNGNGPYPQPSVAGAPSWCNPPGRALGEQPTAEPGLDRVDALLWVKYPGESDGSCRPGEPELGVWWPEYALGLAERARDR